MVVWGRGEEAVARCSHTPAQGTGQSKRCRVASLSLLGKFPWHRCLRWEPRSPLPFPRGTLRNTPSPPGDLSPRGAQRTPVDARGLQAVATGLPESLLVAATAAGETGTLEAAGGGLGRTPGGAAAVPAPPAAPGVGLRGAGRGGWLAERPRNSLQPPDPSEAWGRVSRPRPRLREGPQRGRNRSRERRGGGAGMERASPGCARPRHHDSVEAWLDDHWDFTFSYFVRKATR